MGSGIKLSERVEEVCPDPRSPPPPLIPLDEQIWLPGRKSGKVSNSQGAFWRQNLQITGSPFSLRFKDRKSCWERCRVTDRKGYGSSEGKSVREIRNGRAGVWGREGGRCEGA